MSLLEGVNGGLNMKFSGDVVFLDNNLREAVTLRRKK